jgi:DNA-binding PadR family transcriptional regulator
VQRRGEFIELAVLGWRRVLSYGTLYPALKKMVRRGLIVESTNATPAPATRRPRIIYEVTEAGHAEFHRLMSEVGPTAWEDDNFDVRFIFFASTDLDIRLRVLEGRRTRLQERLARLEAVPERSPGDNYAVELRRHGLESIRRELRWLNDLIEAERGESTPSPAPERATDQ